MNVIEKTVVIIGFVGSVGGGVFYLDDRHAKSETVKTELKKKADVATVKSLQQTIIIDKIEELEEKEFILEKKPKKRQTSNNSN